MLRTYVLASALALVGGLASSPFPVHAAAADYRFEPIVEPQLSGRNNIVQIRLVRATDGRPVLDAVIVEVTADMGPVGMPTMRAPVKALPVQGGIYRFAVSPGMAGTWALHVAVKIPGEAETVRGTVNASLAK